MKKESYRVRFQSSVDTAVSTYDRVSASLLSSIMIFGSFAVILLLVWLGKLSGPEAVLRDPFQPWPTPAVATGPSDHEIEIEDPELPDLQPPQLAETLDAVSDAMSLVLANVGSPDSNGTGGIGLGKIDPRPIPGPTPPPVSPDYRRWVINYESTDIDQYSKQLSFFNIDIGIVKTDSNAIVRVRDPGGKAQMIDSNRAQEQKTLRYSLKQRRMKRWDELITKRAGANTDNSLLCQFYPESTRQIIRQVEAEALAERGRKLTEVRQTILKVQPAGDGFEFVVLDFNYR